MFLSTRTITERTAKGEPIRTGLAVVLKPGVMVETSGDFEPGDYYATVISCGQHAALIQLLNSGREVVAPYSDLHVAVAPPPPAAEPTAETPDAIDGQSEPLGFPELSGEYDIFDKSMDGHDRRYGVRVPIGALAYADAFGWCRVVGGTEEIAIVIDRQGRQQAERWGVLSVQASGPAFTPTIYKTGPHDPEPISPRQPKVTPSMTAVEIGERINQEFDEINATLKRLSEAADFEPERIENSLRATLADRLEALVDQVVPAIKGGAK